MTGNPWLDFLIVIGIIGGAEETIRRLIAKPIVRVWGKFDRFLDTWNGEPARDGLPARPGLVDRVIAIEYQVHNNGGGSMKDGVDEMRGGLDELRGTVGRIETATELSAKKATKAAEMATESATMATATKAALDEHVEQSKALIEQGRKSEAAIIARQDAQDKVIADLADALPVVARSTPAKEDRP